MLRRSELFKQKFLENLLLSVTVKNFENALTFSEVMDNIV